MRASSTPPRSGLLEPCREPERPAACLQMESLGRSPGYDRRYATDMNSTHLHLLAGVAICLMHIGCGTGGDAPQSEAEVPQPQTDLAAFEAELVATLGPRLPSPGRANERTIKVEGVTIIGSNLAGIHADAILRLTEQHRETDLEVTVNEIRHIDRTHVVTRVARPGGSTEYQISFSDGRWTIDGAMHDFSAAR
jgi:hypothetical protein